MLVEKIMPKLHQETCQLKLDRAQFDVVPPKAVRVEETLREKRRTRLAEMINASMHC